MRKSVLRGRANIKRVCFVAVAFHWTVHLRRRPGRRGVVIWQAEKYIRMSHGPDPNRHTQRSQGLLSRYQLMAPDERFVTRRDTYKTVYAPQCL